MDGAAELGAIQRLRDVVGAELLDEGEQLLPAAVLGQDLQDVCEACGSEARCGQVGQVGQAAAAPGDVQTPAGAQDAVPPPCLSFLPLLLQSTTCCLPRAAALPSLSDSSP